MGLCLFIKPFRSLKGKLQIKGDLKRHSFASLVRSSFISGASVDRRSLYFLNNESSPRFTTSTLHHKHDDRIIVYRSDVKGSAEDNLPELENNESIESEEEEELENLSQKAVEDALSTVTEEYLEDFAHTFVSNILKEIQSVQNSNDIILERQERPTFQEPYNEEKTIDRQVQNDTVSVPYQDINGPQLSPIDYTTLCMPKDYCIFGNKVEKMAKGDREAVLSKRGVWPSDEAVEYQFEFVDMMKRIEAENERALGEVGDNIVPLSRLRDYDVDSDESGDDVIDDDEGEENLTITFEVGSSEINRFPDQLNDLMDSFSDSMPENEENRATSRLASTSHSDHWSDAPPPPSPPVSLFSPHHRRCPLPPPPPYHLIYHHTHPVPHHPIMGSSREAHHLDDEMMVMTRGAVGAKKYEWLHGHDGHGSRTGYPPHWHERRYHQSPTPAQNRAPPFPDRPNFRNGQRFGPRYDRRQNHHQNRDHFTTSNEQTRSETGRYQHQPRTRPTPIPYNPSRQSANYDRPPPPQCRQGARWDIPTHQSHPFRQEWGGASHQFGSSFHHNHPHHHHYVDRNNINRRQR